MDTKADDKPRRMESLALIIGGAKCNANCKHCAGIPLRPYAAKKDGEFDQELIRRTLIESYARGARKLALNGSGEPTLYPKTLTQVLDMIKGLESEGVKYGSIHIYSNGIRIGEDDAFCKEYLPKWRQDGLETIYVTVHSTDKTRNAQIYGVKKYPALERVISNIHDSGMRMRANIVLSKNTTYTKDELVSTVKELSCMGVDRVCAWAVRDMYDDLDVKNAPSEKVMESMHQWAIENPQYNLRVILENERNVYSSGLKLTLFQDGKLSNAWCK